MLLLLVFLSAKVVEFNFSRNIMQTEYTAPIALIAVISGLTCKRGERVNTALY